MRPDPWDKNTYSSPIHDYKRGYYGATLAPLVGLVEDLRTPGPARVRRALKNYMVREVSWSLQAVGVVLLFIAGMFAVTGLMFGALSIAAWYLVALFFAASAALILVARTLTPPVRD